MPFPKSVCPFLAVVLAACSNSINLPVERRDDARKIQVNGNIPRPEEVLYDDTGGNVAAGVGGFAGGLVGGLVVGAIVAASRQDEVALIEEMIGGRKDGATLTMKEEMEGAIRRSSFANVAKGGDARSTMNLKITSLGFIVSGGGNHQFQIEMEAELVGRDGVVIWRSDSGTWPHNDQLPARPFESYRNNHEQFRQDYRASCRWVCDQLIEELKWQVEPGE